MASTPSPGSRNQDAHELTTIPTDTHDPDAVTPLEQEVLDEYARLAGNLHNVSALSVPHPLSGFVLTSTRLPAAFLSSRRASRFALRRDTGRAARAGAED